MYPNYLKFHYRINFNINGFNRLQTTAVNLDDFNYNSTLFTDVHFTPGNCLVKIWGPLKSQEAIFISQDGSHQVKLLQVRLTELCFVGTQI